MYISKKKQEIIDAFETQKEKDDYINDLKMEYKEKLKERKARYCKKNPEKVKESVRKYHKENPEKIMAYEYGLNGAKIDLTYDDQELDFKRKEVISKILDLYNAQAIDNEDFVNVLKSVDSETYGNVKSVKKNI